MMMKFFTILFAISISFLPIIPCHAQDTVVSKQSVIWTPLQAAQAQLVAYNQRNLEAFVDVFADDVKVFREPNREPSISGKTAFTAAYKKRFETVGLRAEILNRMEVGNKVIEHERVYGIRDQPYDLAVVYEVVNGKIKNVWFFSADASP